MYRSTALFLTNKENFVADSGSPSGTVVNSDRQLWSVAGSLAMVYRVFFGMEFAVDSLHLHPVIPEALGGTRTLTNFHYRHAVLSITVKGFGGQVSRMTIDGVAAKQIVPANLSGNHVIVIELVNRSHPGPPINLVESRIAPETPRPQFSSGDLTWKAVDGASRYQIYRNGKFQTTTNEMVFQTQPTGSPNQLQVAALEPGGTSSFLSEPVPVAWEPLTFPAVPLAAETSAASYVTLEQTGVTGLSISGQIPTDGRYTVVFKYANGSGPVNTGSRCAIRTLFIDGHLVGPIVLPQRGAGQWDNWGLSNIQIVRLMAGRHSIELRLLPADLNMDGSVNRARIQSVELVRID